MKTYLKIGVVLMLTAGNALAQWRHDNHFKLSNMQPADSQVELASVTPVVSDVHWIWVQVEKEGRKDDSFFEIFSGGDFSRKIWLRYGPGQYKIKVMSSKTEQRVGSYAIEEAFIVTNTDLKEVDNTAPTADIQSDTADIIDLADYITHNLTTDKEKTQAIHDWVAGNIAYDVESFMDGSYVLKKWDAASMFESRKAICAGYANLTAALNRAAGIPAKIVNGEALAFGATQWTGRTNHAWNEVWIDGRWMIQDTTWDAGNVDLAKRSFTFMLRQKYFDPDPAVFGKDHRSE